MTEDTSRAPAVIRLAAQDDAADIAAVLRDSFAEFALEYTPRAYDATVSSKEGIVERLGEGPIWVAHVGERMVGTASAVVTKQGLYIRGMGIVPEGRGRRLGWILLEHIERFARDQGLERMYLSTTPFLHAAIRLYENYGFLRSAGGPTHLFGTPLFSMERAVNLEE